MWLCALCCTPMQMRVRHLTGSGGRGLERGGMAGRPRGCRKQEAGPAGPSHPLPWSSRNRRTNLPPHKQLSPQTSTKRGSDHRPCQQRRAKHAEGRRGRGGTSTSTQDPSTLAPVQRRRQRGGRRDTTAAIAIERRRDGRKPWRNSRLVTKF